MASIKVYGEKQYTLACEIAKIVGKSVKMTSDSVEFDIDDVVELRLVAEDASDYWRRVKKPSMSKAAAFLRESFYAVESHERNMEQLMIGR